MRSAAAARRYARALFSIAKDDGAIEPVAGDLARMAELLDAHPELRHALTYQARPGSDVYAIR